MPWTKADREIVLEAIRDIADGKRVTQIMTADRQETYQVASLDDLQKLLDRIDAVSPGTAPRPRILRSRYSKGL